MQNEARGDSRKDQPCIVCGETRLAKLCTGCRSIAYCSVDHQRQHWRLHRPFCKKVAATRNQHWVTKICKDFDWWPEKKGEQIDKKFERARQSMEIIVRGMMIPFPSFLTQKCPTIHQTQVWILLSVGNGVLTVCKNLWMGVAIFLEILQQIEGHAHKSLQPCIEFLNAKWRHWRGILPPPDPDEDKQLDHIMGQMPEVNNFVKMIADKYPELRRNKK